MSIFEQILPDPTVRQGLIEDLKTTLNGQKNTIQVIYFYGQGCNGKSTLISALERNIDITHLSPMPPSYASQENMRKMYKLADDEGITAWYPLTDIRGRQLEANKIYVISDELFNIKYHELFVELMNRPSINATFIFMHNRQPQIDPIPSYVRIVEFPIIFDPHIDTDDARKNRINQLANELKMSLVN